MKRMTDLTRTMSQSESTLNEGTSIKHRLRSASKGTLLSEGRQTPITFPSEDLALAESCVESADEEVGHPGLMQDAWFNDALQREDDARRETLTSHGCDNTFTNAEAEERMKMSYAAALEEKQRKGEELFNKEAEERLSQLKKYFMNNNAHTGKVTFHNSRGELWRREELPNSEVRLFKTTYRDIPLGAVVRQGLPEENAARADAADAEVSGILRPKPTEALIKPPQVKDVGQQSVKENAAQPLLEAQPDNKLMITNVKGSAFKEFNQAASNEVGELKEMMQRMAAQMEAMQKRELERLSQSEDVNKKRGARKRQKSPDGSGSDFSEEDFVYSKEAKPENRRKVTARKGRQRSASRCDRELFPNKGACKTSQQAKESEKVKSSSKDDECAGDDATMNSVVSMVANQ